MARKQNVGEKILRKAELWLVQDNRGEYLEILKEEKAKIDMPTPKEGVQVYNRMYNRARESAIQRLRDKYPFLFETLKRQAAGLFYED